MFGLSGSAACALVGTVPPSPPPAMREWDAPCAPAGPFAGGVQLSGQLRLVGGPSPAEGRVEAQLASGEWTAFCQSGAASAASAEVVCRQLGLDGPAALRLGVYPGTDGAGQRRLIEVLQCGGSEGGLDDCFLAPEATDACSQAGALGVACSGEASAARQGRGRGKTGRQVGNSWGMLVERSIRRPSPHSSCWQRLPSLSTASHSPQVPHRCTQAQLSWLCPPPRAGAQTVQDVRLSGGASSEEGLLEIRLAGHGGRWGSVCASQLAAAAAASTADSSGAAFTAYLALAEAQNAAAEVACRTLNLTGGVARVGAGFYSTDASKVPAALIDGLACSGGEEGVSACGFSGASACSEGQLLGVACAGAKGWRAWACCCPSLAWGMGLWECRMPLAAVKPALCLARLTSSSAALPPWHPLLPAGAQTVAGLRLVGGPTPREGRLEVQIAGQWGTVSALGTNPFEAAAVACRQLGWSTYGVQAQGVSFYGDGELPLLLWGIVCDGSEPTLSDCHLTHAPAGAGPATEAFSISCAGERAVVGR